MGYRPKSDIPLQRYGGIVPRSRLPPARCHHPEQKLEAALDQAQLPWDAIDGIAATCTPGLVGALAGGADHR